MAGHRPCPYCGGSDLVGSFTYHPRHQCIKCRDCGARGPDAENVADAWHRWDSRKSVNATEIRDYLDGIRGHVADAKGVLVEQQRRAEL